MEVSLRNSCAESSSCFLVILFLLLLSILHIFLFSHFSLSFCFIIRPFYSTETKWTDLTRPPVYIAILLIRIILLLSLSLFRSLFTFTRDKSFSCFPACHHYLHQNCVPQNIIRVELRTEWSSRQGLSKMNRIICEEEQRACTHHTI